MKFHQTTKLKANLDRYYIVRTIGSGMYSTVYRAFDQTQKIVALKILNDTYNDREKAIENFIYVMSLKPKFTGNHLLEIIHASKTGEWIDQDKHGLTKYRLNTHYLVTSHAENGALSNRLF